MQKKNESQIKGPLSPFFIFRTEVYDSVKRDNPDAKVTDLAKILSNMWENLDEV